MAVQPSPPASRLRISTRQQRRRLKGWFGAKNWDDHVAHCEEVAQSEGFRGLRDRIIRLARLRPGDRVLDVGAGTGLLALAVAPSVQHVCALDVSPAMCRHLRGKAASRGIPNLDVVNGSAAQLPLPEGSVDVVLSNYCYHHLDDADKHRALAEARRVLRPGGRLVVGDMMFRVRVSDPRDRAIIAKLVVAMIRRGPGGLLRLAKNALRYVSGRWEQPADAAWWRVALTDAGFAGVDVEPLHHEGGIAVAHLAAVPARQAA